jgi:AraC family transcriptional regulator
MEGDGVEPSTDSPPGPRIVRELEARLDSSNLVLEALGLELIAILSGIDERPSSRAAPRWLLLAKELIEDCSSNDLRIPDLASAAGVHPVYLARAYRRHFGYSPGEYLRRCRLLRVQALLAKTDMPLVQIALQCGYSDQSQMTRAFGAVFGMPPARYRALRGT